MPAARHPTYVCGGIFALASRYATVFQICSSEIDSCQAGIAVILMPCFTIQNSSLGLNRCCTSSR
jgi:hypothetical protein